MSCCHESEVNKSSFIGASILSLLGLPGNILVIALIFRAKEKRSTTTYLLLSLALADLGNLLAVDIYALLVLLVKSLEVNETVLFLLTVSAKIIANFTLTLIAVERYMALVKANPKSIINHTRKKILIANIGAWLTGLAICTAMALYETLVDEHQTWHFHLFWSIPLGLGYAVPLAIQTWFYISVVKNVFFGGAIMGHTVTSETNLRGKMRLIRILIVITLVFLMCNVPAIAILVLQHAEAQKDATDALCDAMLILGCLSSFLNPFLYGLQSSTYRKQVKQLFCEKHVEVEDPRVLVRPESPTFYDTKL